MSSPLMKGGLYVCVRKTYKDEFRWLEIQTQGVCGLKPLVIPPYNF